MNATEFLWAIGRATVFTSASVLMALALVALLRVRSPQLHRAAWFLAVLPSWLLVPWTWRVETPPAVTPTEALYADLRTEVAVSPAASIVPMPVAESHATTNPVRPLLVVFLGGMIALLGVGFARYLRFVQRLPRSKEPLDPDWQQEWQRQLRALRSRRPIELGVTPDLGPLLCFVPCRYLVLVPRPLWIALARGQRIAILRHELAHWQRGDLWWSLAIRALALPQWFNPLAWLAIQRFDEAGEWACDDLVSRGRRAHQLAFAHSLLATAEFATTNSPGTAAIQGGQLARRVRRLISDRFKEEAMIKKFLLIVPLSAIVLVQAIRIERVIAEEPSHSLTEPAGKTDTRIDSTPRSPGGNMPPYIIEPPDMLSINGVRLIPKPPHKIEPFDGLLVRVIGALPEHPIADAFAVDSDGQIDFGPPYGRVEVAGLTVDQAKLAIMKRLHEIVTDPDVSLSMAFAAAAQKVQGKYLVAPDGRVNLGVYGTVFVAGLTIDEARAAIEKRLSDDLRDPQVVVDVTQYNSKKYYVITRHPGRGDNVVTAPITGNDTVLDALALVDDALKQSSTKIWISRPADRGTITNQILPVNWDQIVDGTSTATNYQLLAGDRLFVVNREHGGDLSHAAGPARPDASPTPQSPYAGAPPTYSPPETPKYRVEPTPATVAGGQLVTFEVKLVNDKDHNLAEFDARPGQPPFAVLESDAILPTLRILANNALIEEAITPQIVCQLGIKGQVTFDGKAFSGLIGDKPTLSFQPDVRDGKLVLQLGLWRGENGALEFSSTIPLVPGRTVLIRADAMPATAKTGVKPGAMYAVLTPTLVGEPWNSTPEGERLPLSDPPKTRSPGK